MANSSGSPKSTSRIILIIAGILVLTSLGYFATQYFSEKSENKNNQVQIEELNSEILSLEEKILDFEVTLENRDVTIQKKDEELAFNQDEIARLRGLLAQAEKEGKVSRGKIKELEQRLELSTRLNSQYEEEIAVLREQNELLTGQVDSLIVNETELKGANQSLLQQRDAAKQELDETREIASVLKTRNLLIYNARRNKDVEGLSFRRYALRDLKVCFTIMENPLAASGQKEVYLVFENPDGTINTNDQSGQFRFGGANRTYSASATVAYNNIATDLCIQFVRPEDFEYQKGPQYLSLYADGNLIGQGSFTVK